MQLGGSESAVQKSAKKVQKGAKKCKKVHREKSHSHTPQTHKFHQNHAFFEFLGISRTDSSGKKFEI